MHDALGWRGVDGWIIQCYTGETRLYSSTSCVSSVSFLPLRLAEFFASVIGGVP
jgi:hypothetical protein